MLRFITALVVLTMWFLLPPAAFGGLWDSDTLVNEAKGLPEVMQVITVRYERNPPLYYQMRLKRVTAELAKNPRLLADYDDASVACDRLSQKDEAISWMEKKRVQLEKDDQNASEVKKHWYRYHANIGTLLAGRWLVSGAPPKHMADVRRAQEEIARALKIDSTAHSACEKVQLALISWMIHPMVKVNGKEKPVDFYGYILEREPEPGDKPVFRRDIPGGGGTREEWVKGLCGVIALGYGWESVDTLDALARLEMTDNATLGYLVWLRCEELDKRGNLSFYPSLLNGAIMKERWLSFPRWLARDKQEDLREKYEQLRAEADAWYQRRYEFMIVLLNARHHPDTYPIFWNGWKDPGPPDLAQLARRPWYKVILDPRFIEKHAKWYGLILLILVDGVVLILWRRRKLRLLRAQRYSEERKT